MYTSVYGAPAHTCTHLYTVYVHVVVKQANDVIVAVLKMYGIVSASPQIVSWGVAGVVFITILMEALLVLMVRKCRQQLDYQRL